MGSIHAQQPKQMNVKQMFMAKNNVPLQSNDKFLPFSG
jgi:hypothetical protein